MTGSGSSKPQKPNPPRQEQQALRKPIQVIHISRKEEEEAKKRAQKEADEKLLTKNSDFQIEKLQGNSQQIISPNRRSKYAEESANTEVDFQTGSNLSMGDLLDNPSFSHDNSIDSTKYIAPEILERTVDDFDFDEEAFLAALDENEPIGATGEIARGSVIGVESDGVYVDIGGKAPGFMPKNECGLGVITNLKEKFPKGLEVEVLVTREQNADGMVTISCRALALRKSWEKVMGMAKESKVVEVKINGFNRGGVTCDLEGLRGFIPRSQLEQGEKHESLVGKSFGVAFLEVNPETRKLILSEKKAATAALFAKLKIGQLIEGKVIAIKPYGFFVDLGGISGLLHQSMITNGSLRSLREVFNQGDCIKAMVTDLDPARGRIGLNTALLEGIPGEILIDKEKLFEEAEERARKAQSLFQKKNESKE